MLTGFSLSKVFSQLYQLRAIPQTEGELTETLKDQYASHERLYIMSLMIETHELEQIALHTHASSAA